MTESTRDMDERMFRAMLETLELPSTADATRSIRASAPSSGPTIAFSSTSTANDLGTTAELELGKTLGQGGMGLVRSANQRALHREVAVKTLRPDRKSDDAAAALLHEALVTGGLEHPNIVPVYTLGQTADGAPLIVMKRIEGVPWDDCIADPTLAPNLADDDPLAYHLDIFLQVCLAVAFAHSHGIVHRDIKPENVMIGAFGEVYLVDWGIAFTVDEEKAEYLLHRDRIRGISGTPGYMAPEMTLGEGARLGTFTDVYLLGATLHHVITGSPPHDGATVMEVLYRAYQSEPYAYPPEVGEVAEICRRAMAREPDTRFPSAEALRRAVLDLQRHESSREIAARADERFTSMRGAVESTPSPEADVRESFAQARFGFQQALELWPENARAAAGLDELIEAMIRFEISQDNDAAARALLTQLEAPSAALTAELEDLERRLAEGRREFERLRVLEREERLSEGATARAATALVAVVFWGATPFLAWALDVTGWLPFTEDVYRGHGFVLGAFFATIVGVQHRTFLRNEANRRIVSMFVVIGVFTAVYRFVAIGSGLSVMSALAIEHLAYSVMIAAVALISRRSPWVAFAAYGIGGVLASSLPAHTLLIAGFANVSAMAALAWEWRDLANESTT